MKKGKLLTSILTIALSFALVSPTASFGAAKATTLTCYKGNVVKKVIAVVPKCPIGYSTKKPVVAKPVPIPTSKTQPPSGVGPVPFPTPPVVSGNSVASVVDGNSYTIDSTGPGGGVVFYYSVTAFSEPHNTTLGGVGSSCGNNCHYLEFAPVDWFPSTTFPSLPWSSDAFGSTYALDTKVGSGFSNTNAIIVNSLQVNPKLGTSDGAFQARSYAGNDNSVGQWFLPSIDELNLFWNSSFFKKLVGTSMLAVWSSTDVGGQSATYKTGSAYGMDETFSLKGNSKNIITKSTNELVIPVRAF